MEDANILLQKFPFFTDISISAPPSEISDALLLIWFQMDHFM
jgi:hypothetical protein